MRSGGQAALGRAGQMTELRDIHDLAGCRGVVAVQVAVWGRDAETVPASVLSVSVKRGGILIGACDGDTVVGFVWSFPGRREGQWTHWSHMLAVLPTARGRGLGRDLKLAQRTRAIEQGIELIEWTFDPLQAQNAHLNFVGLGCIATTYVVDAYGPMSGPLHRGTPTDRLIAEWWIARPHVERRLNQRTALVARSADVREAPALLETHPGGTWLECGDVRTSLTAPRVLLPVPPAFGEMQQQDIDAAMRWRLGVREAFSWAFARGYRAVDFYLNREQGGGAYLLALDQVRS
jgi:predicted GNAT superfamily acetyltransferase